MKIMTEKEKMLTGQMYDASDDELVKDRLNTRKLLREYNFSDPEDMENRRRILKELLADTGNVPYIEPPFYCDYGSNIRLGHNVYMNFNCIVLDCNTVEIGDNTFFGPNVQVYTATHPVRAEERIKGPEMAFPIRIGNNVWVGGSSVILPGVTIGDNSTIAAGSVVTKSIPANVVAGGNPCRVIRELE